MGSNKILLDKILLDKKVKDCLQDYEKPFNRPVNTRSAVLDRYLADKFALCFYDNDVLDAPAPYEFLGFNDTTWKPTDYKKIRRCVDSIRMIDFRTAKGRQQQGGPERLLGSTRGSVPALEWYPIWSQRHNRQFSQCGKSLIVMVGATGIEPVTPPV